MKTFFPLAAPLAVVLLATTTPAQAEDLTAEQKAAERAAAKQASQRVVDLVVRHTETSDGDLRVGPAMPGLQLTADGDATSASFTVARNWQLRTKPIINALSFKVATPLDKSTKDGNFLTAAGRFSSGTSLGFSFTQMYLPNSSLVGTAEQRDAAVLEMIEKLRGGGKLTCLEPAQGPCPEHDALVKTGLVPKVESLVDRAFVEGTIWQWGVSGEISKPTFDYRDPLTLVEQSEDHMVYSAALHTGWRLNGDRTYLGGAIEYGNSRKESAKRILCGPPPATGPTECFNSPYAPPTHEESTSLMGVARWRAPRDSRTPYAVEVKAGYDTEAKVYGLVGSLYLVSDADGGLRGGLRAGWQSDDEDPTTDDDNFTVGVFIGAPFQVF